MHKLKALRFIFYIYPACEQGQRGNVRTTLRSGESHVLEAKDSYQSSTDCAAFLFFKASTALFFSYWPKTLYFTLAS